MDVTTVVSCVDFSPPAFLLPFHQRRGYTSREKEDVRTKKTDNNYIFEATKIFFLLKRAAKLLFVLYFTISHANLCVAVSLYQLSMDGSFYHLELQLIWSRVNVAHGQLLTACMRHRNGEELEA